MGNKLIDFFLLLKIVKKNPRKIVNKFVILKRILNFAEAQNIRALFQLFFYSLTTTNREKKKKNVAINEANQF